MTKKVVRTAVTTSSVNVFEVLRFVSDCSESLGVTEIGRRLNLPASTVYRALVTLEEASYLQRYQNTPRYEVGIMPNLLNRALLNRFALHSACRQLLHELAEETGDTVSLWARLGWYAVRIGGAFGNHDIYHRARLGETAQLHHGPAPAAILAHLSMSDQKLYRAFAQTHHPDRPPSHGWDVLSDRLSALRNRGFARQILPIAASFAAVALPLRGPDGAPVAALMTEGGSDAPEPEPAQSMYAAQQAIEQMIAADANRFASPFAHLPIDSIRLQFPSGSAD